MDSKIRRSLWVPTGRGVLAVLVGMTWAAAALAPTRVHAIPMQNDPEGFHGISWGAPLDTIKELTLSSSWDHMAEYEFNAGPPRLGEAPLTSVKLTTVNGKFARVTIHYQGTNTHTQVLAYLEERYGVIELMPGSMVRGLNQQFNWRGPETEINLTYQGMGERGFVFIESRTLAPRFTDVLSEHSH